jgi:hypothetical protein
VQMRKKVRGLRKIEQAVLKHQRAEESSNATGADAAVDATADATLDGRAETADTESAGAVVLEYCAAVRGILNDDQGGPLRPPGLRMADALSEVRDSIQRNLDEKKGGSRRRNSADWPAASTEDSTPCDPNKSRCATT